MAPRKDKEQQPEGAAPENKKKGLAAARAIMNKVFPAEKSAEVQIDEARFTQSHPHLPTGSVIIDHLIGGIPNRLGVLPCPGFPRGRLINIYGSEAAGKTTLSLTVAAETCRRGGSVLFIDWEHAIDIAYAKSLGVPIDDPDRFLLVQPETLEKGLAYLWGMAKAGVDLIIIDSVAAGATQAQWDQTIAEKAEKGVVGRVGAKAAMWSEYLPQLKAVIARTNTCVVGIAQLRASIQTGYHKGGSTEPQAQGGYAWKFYSEVRIGLRKIKTEKGTKYDAITNTNIETPVGNVVLAKIDKCKVSASQGREAMFYLVFGEGIDDLRSMIEMATSRGVIKGQYNWERKDGTLIKGRGMKAFKQALVETPGAMDEFYHLSLSSGVLVPETPMGIGGDFDPDEETVKEIQNLMSGGTPEQPPIQEETEE